MTGRDMCDIAIVAHFVLHNVMQNYHHNLSDCSAPL